MDEQTRHDHGSSGPQRGVLVAVSALAGVTLVLYLAVSAFDIFLLVLLCGTIVLLERTVGDWLVDTLGPAAGIMLFVGVVAALVGGLLGTPQGRAARDEALRIGTERGLATVFVSPSSMPRLPGQPPPSSSTPASGTRRSSSSGAVATTSPAAASSRARPGSAGTPASSGQGSQRASAGSGQPLGTAGAAGRPGAQSAGGRPVSPDVHAGGGSAVAVASADLPAPSQPRESTRPAPPAPTQVTVRAIPTDQETVVVLKAEVKSGPSKVTSGEVEITLNGRLVARLPLKSDGAAEARIANLSPGLYRVTARLLATEDFAESKDETSFSVRPLQEWLLG
jgi:hypothetical protein